MYTWHKDHHICDLILCVVVPAQFYYIMEIGDKSIVWTNEYLVP